MSPTPWIVGLVMSGGSLQILGVLLVVKEIAADRRLAREVLERSQHEVERSYAPGLTERDKQMVDFRQQLLEETIKPTRRETQARVAAVDRALSGFLHDQLTGRVTARLWGVILIVLGLALGTAGSAWGVLV